ncbi:MAG: hypothetical protein OXG04_17885 [Acidobacteria bacterium]|nr:hypothetical protein [Acidobacteriota bacterium]
MATLPVPASFLSEKSEGAFRTPRREGLEAHAAADSIYDEYLREIRQELTPARDPNSGRTLAMTGQFRGRS